MKNKIILLLLLLVAIFLRVYRTSDLLGFWFDQGRDALVVWDFVHDHKFFLIGPTTGIAGIFRGPWYYWLLIPFYLLGNGNPVVPAVFLALSTVLAAYLTYKVTLELGGARAAWVALIVSGLSYGFVQSARWLSNPTPMFLISISLVYFLIRVFKGHTKSWIPIGFLLGQAMQFGSATEIFLFPAFLMILIIHKSIRPSLKIGIISAAAVLLAFLPQIIFDLRHQGILRQGIQKFLITDESFKLSFWETLKVRLPFYYHMYSSKLFPSGTVLVHIFMFTALASLLVSIKKFSPPLNSILIIFLSPLLGMLFFHGNQGHVYDYYFTGFFLVFVILFSILISKWKLVMIPFLVFFLYQNIPLSLSHLKIDIDNYSIITLSNQLKAVHWVYTDAGDTQFNTDFYVPPMIPYAYDYLFRWQGDTVYHKQPTTPLLKRLYTIVEPDPDHQTLLNTWSTRQSYYSSVETTQMFGPLTVQRRARHGY